MKAKTNCFLVSKDLVVPLTTEAPIILGRDPTSSNFVLTDERVSRAHAMILARDGEYFVRDLNSSNGTLVNGRKIINATPLKPGDVIAISPFKLEFVRPANAPAESKSDDHEPRRAGFSDDKLEGSISALPVVDLVQLLNSTLQSGVLTITDEHGYKADLIFLDGEIVQAHYRGHHGENAIFALMRSRQGRFEFTKTDRLTREQRERAPELQREQKPSHRQIARRTQSILLEGARLMDESAPSPTPAPIKTSDSGNVTLLGPVSE